MEWGNPDLLHSHNKLMHPALLSSNGALPYDVNSLQHLEGDPRVFRLVLEVNHEPE